MDEMQQSEVLKALQNVLNKPGNNGCADCGAQDCSWASTTLGCFVCIRCSGIHRCLGVHISRIKSVQLDHWSEAELEKLQKYGNDHVNSLYTERVPDVYKRPTTSSPLILVEHWIRAKYDWKEFHRDVCQMPIYIKGVKSGTLFKKGKDREVWAPRHFFLDRLHKSVCYFEKANIENQKMLGQIPLADLYILLTDKESTGRANCIHILSREGSKMRSVYAAATMPRDAVEWYYSVRALQTELGFSHRCVDARIETVLEKTPPEGRGAWRKRWCLLISDKLLYYKTHMDPHPKGEITLRAEDTVEKVHQKEKHVKSGPDYMFILTTSKRNYYWGTPNEEVCTSWIYNLSKAIKQCADTS